MNAAKLMLKTFFMHCGLAPSFTSSGLTMQCGISEFHRFCGLQRPSFMDNNRREATRSFCNHGLVNLEPKELGSGTRISH